MGIINRQGGYLVRLERSILEGFPIKRLPTACTAEMTAFRGTWWGLWEDCRVSYVTSRDDFSSESMQSIVLVAHLFWDRGIPFAMFFWMHVHYRSPVLCSRTKLSLESPHLNWLNSMVLGFEFVQGLHQGGNMDLLRRTWMSDIFSSRTCAWEAVLNLFPFYI